MIYSRKATDPEQTLQWYSRFRRHHRAVSAIDGEDLKLRRLGDIFPDQSEQHLRSTLTQSGGNVEAAVEQLLFGNSPDEEARGMIWSAFMKAAQAGMIVLDNDGWERAPWEISASGGSSSTETHGNGTDNTTRNRASPTTSASSSSFGTIDGAKSITAEGLHQPGKGKKESGFAFLLLFTALVFCWTNIISDLSFLFIFAISVAMFLSRQNMSESRGVTQESDTKTESKDHDLIEW